MAPTLEIQNYVVEGRDVQASSGRPLIDDPFWQAAKRGYNMVISELDLVLGGRCERRSSGFVSTYSETHGAALNWRSLLACLG